jgi:glycosyltransferase involved in cell wall biosynthesis
VGLARRSLKFYVERSWYHYRAGGIGKIFAVAAKKLSRFLPASMRPNLISAAVSQLSFIAAHPETKPLTPPDGKADPRSLDLHWLVANFSEGSGGHMTIFRMIQQLERLGHRNTIWFYEQSKYATEEEAQRAVCEQFLPLKAQVRFVGGHPERIVGDAVIATHWWSAYHARSVTRVRKRFYFVQDFEPSFYPMGSEYLLAENTYRFGFTCITAGKWLESLMRDRFENRAFSFDLAYDPKVYFEDAAVKRAGKRVAFYARVTTPRRAVELGFLALELAAARIPGLHVDFFGWPVGKLSLPYGYTDHGILNHTQLAMLYRETAAGIVFSATNYSLVPQEMMACGLPVIDLEGENTRAVFPSGAITLSKPDPQAIADDLVSLLSGPKAQQAARLGFDFVRTLSWEKSGEQIARGLAAELAGV